MYIHVRFSLLFDKKVFTCTLSHKQITDAFSINLKKNYKYSDLEST